MFQPDIVVTARDSTESYVVVEVKSRPEPLAEAEDALREYMAWNNYSLGMLVAVGEIRLFRNRFSRYDRDSVERIGIYPLRAFDELATIARATTADGGRVLGAAQFAARLEDSVQGWVQELPHAPLDAEREDLRRVLKEEFAPYIRDGIVRAAHARERMSRASDGHGQS